MKKVTGFICGPRIYQYDNWLFENHAHIGPWPLKKDYATKKKAGSKFWKMIEKFNKLTDLEKNGYRIGGGCVPF